MGDPRKQRKKYATPPHPWQKARIEEEKELLKGYGLKNKKEIWKMTSKLHNFAQQAKRLVASTKAQSSIEKKQLMDRLVSLGLIKEDAKLEDVLTITVKDIMERRLQTRIYKMGLSKSVKQARQFIVHRHISVDGKLVTFPSYLITKDKENKIAFIPSSSLSNHEHAERKAVTKAKKEKPKKRKEKAE